MTDLDFNKIEKNGRKSGKKLNVFLLKKGK
jgi:hypothetical protein